MLFILSLAGLSWLLMMAVHELGHVVGALVTRGQIQCVILHPLAISRTDVTPNPNPAVVVWLGPIIGCLLPLVGAMLIPPRFRYLRPIAAFFAGFCLLANGSYISIGVFDRIGDCGEMLRTGTPMWLMFAFGAVTIPFGLMIWHRLGSLKQFLSHPEIIPPRIARTTAAWLTAIIIAELLCSPA